MNPADPIRSSYDVVVVGARCAGAATAMLLARAGLSVLAVERASLGADTLSTHALTKPGVLQLSRWRVLDAVRDAGTPRVDTVIQRYGDEVVEVAITPTGDVDGLYAPRRTVLDRLLVGSARDAGATVVHGTAVTDLVFDESGRVEGVVLGRDGRGVRVRSRLVIGADGARSFVARRVGARREHRSEASTAAVYAYLPGLPDHAYQNHFVRGVAAGVIPTNDGVANVWVNVPMEHFSSLVRGGVAGFYVAALGSIDPSLAARAERCEDLRIRRFVGLRGFSRQPWGRGWALVGDAGYFKDPLSAHGMTDALIGAELLARSVVKHASGTDEATAFDEYASTRDRLARPMTAAVDRLATFDWDPSEVQPLQQEMNQAMRDEWRYLSALPSLPSRHVQEAAS